MGYQAGRFVFQRSVEIPLDRDGYFMFRCPSSEEHVFKGAITEGDVVRWAEGNGPFLFRSAPYLCPYCGRRLTLSTMAPSITTRVEAAVSAIERDAVLGVARSLERSLKPLNRTAGPIRLKATVQMPSPRQFGLPAPWPGMEESRVEVVCRLCGEAFAVFGRAAFCWRCGPLDPCQRALIWLESLAKRLDLVRHQDLPDQVRQLMADFGISAGFREDAIIHGLSAVEATLLDIYRDRDGRGGRPRIETLLSSAEMKELELEALWHPLGLMREVRNSLVHRGGLIDDKLIAECSQYEQMRGQRLTFSQQEATAFLDSCEIFVRQVDERRTREPGRR